MAAIATIRALQHRALPLVLAVLAVALVLPALSTGFQLDDHFHRMRLLGYGEPAIQLFVFFDGDPAKTQAAMDQGWVPWWTAPRFRHASLRYLSVLTMQLDYLLWPHHPWLMHLHSLLWLGALVAATALLYRRILGGATWAAGLAALLYAVDDAHAEPTAYLANRNALISTCFGVLCLVCHARWREERWGAGVLLSPLCLALALAAGEMALATAGYLLAYALFLDRAPPRGRLASLAPNGLVLAAWAAIYKLGHFGAAGSGFYVEPLADPVAFARGLVERVPFLLLGQWTPFPADLGSSASFLRALGSRAQIAALLLVLLLGLLLRPLLRGDRAARFWALGAALSLLPIAAVGPQDRLLFFVGLGSMALLAQAAHGHDAGNAAPLRSGPSRAVAMAVVGLFLFFHLLIAPVLAVVRAAVPGLIGARMTAAIASVPSDPEIASQDLILVNPPEHIYLVTAIPVVKSLQGAPAPARLRTLAQGGTELRITRVDDRTLRAELADGLFPSPFSRYFRSTDLAFEPGQRFELTGFTVEVDTVSDAGDPTTLLYRFAVPLEDPSLRWLRWGTDAYLPWRPPPIGETAVLPPAIGFLG